MAYGTLLLHLDEHPQLEARIDLALRLACRFKSHLVGLAATGMRPLETSALGDLLKPDQLADVGSSARRRAQERVQKFSDRARRSGVPGFEARIDDDDDVHALMRAALYSDLTILGQPDPDFRGYSQRRAQFEEVLLHGAAPTLVLPFRPLVEDLGTRVLVGWNDSRECARAVAAAMPMLQQASQVHVIGFSPSPDNAPDIAPPQIDRVREWLARNDVQADAWIHACGEDAGYSLLAQAARSGVNLIVMGAWGHARWAERIFGGATQTVLARTPLPVLMAH